ncbi:helix-turn-helix domain-containing protein [Epidermidibacterium keratini]|uniref:Helix-turn-helix domain-containing protein n=1 Tax=Epidermidibacterium keratini TaxID=1891644 RepID=A0A7L4YNL2_9ACTN|nr:TOBE domain-containing protein [Epidermidibacterium keratini]QHC00726.1 helix-turn-helix domain-containing protein [Epidermidibacterium keratini]
MAQLRISEAAELLGVSSDTVRRWVESGKVKGAGSGPLGVDARDLARFAADQAHTPDPGRTGQASARNRMKGIVTRVTSDQVMSQVEIQAGPYRIVSLLSTEAVREMKLEVGSVAIANVKATNVALELPDGKRA